MQGKGIAALASVAAVALALTFWIRLGGSAPTRPNADEVPLGADPSNPVEARGHVPSAGRGQQPGSGAPIAGGDAPVRSKELGKGVDRHRVGSAPVRGQGSWGSGGSGDDGSPAGPVVKWKRPDVVPRAADRPQRGFNDGSALNTADQPAPAESQEGVLLSIPFRNGISPEVGGAATQADSLVSKDGGVEFNEKSQLSFPADGHVQSGAGTIALDVTAAWGEGNSSNQALVTIGSADGTGTALQVVKNATGLLLVARDAEGVAQYVRYPLEGWSNGDPHRVAATWDEPTQSVALYVDGDLIGTAPYAGLTIDDKTVLHIGSDRTGGFPSLHGTLGSLKVLNKALEPDAVADQ